MSETSIIREFLVALGFKSDEAALKKFENGIASATKSVFALAGAVEATAVTVAAGVARFASNLEALYFASIKTNSSATNLRAFDRAAQNLGTTSGEALQSVQGLARFLRNNPGGEGLLESIGVQTRDANHQLRDTTDLMIDLGRQLSKQPYYLANQYAGIFGISEDTLRAILNGDFAAQVSKMRAEMRNTGFEQASKDAHEFMMNLRDLQTYVEAFGIKVEEALAKRLGVSMKDLTTWFAANGPMWADKVAEILVSVIDLAERIGKGIGWLIGKFVEWDKATDGWSTKLLATLAVLKLFGGAEIIGGVLSLAGAFVKLGTSIAATQGGALGLTRLAGGVLAAGAGGYLFGKEVVAPWIDSLVQKSTGRNDETLGGWLYEFLHRGQNAVRFFTDRGWTRAQAAGIAANLDRESHFSPSNVGDNGNAYGIAQWHADRQAAFKRWSGKDIRDSTYEDQLGFVDYELRQGSERAAGNLLRATTNAQQAGEVVSRYYERPASADMEARIRGQQAVHIEQATTIHVHGTDPAATGKAVAAEQGRVNADLRNLIPAVQ